MLISKDQFVTMFEARIDVTKKISKPQNVKETLTRIYYTLEYFNSQPEFTSSLGGRNLSDIIIADEWKDFIIPETVRLDPTDIKTENLLVRKRFEDVLPNDIHNIPELDKESAKDEESKRRIQEATRISEYVKLLTDFKAETYNQFINDQSRIRSYFKSDLNSNTTNLATLRANKSLMDIIPIMAVRYSDKDIRCRSLDEPYIPVEIVSSLNCLFRSDYYNVDMEYMFYDYMSKKVIV